MAGAVDQGRLALATLDDEAAALVAADRPDVVGEHAQIDPVQPEHVEGMGEDETHRLATEPDPEPSGIIKADRQTRPAVMLVQPIEARLAEQPPLMLDDPGMRVRAQRVEPALDRLRRQRRERAGGIAAEHAHDPGIPAQRQPRLDILGAGLAQPYFCGRQAQGRLDPLLTP